MITTTLNTNMTNAFQCQNNPCEALPWEYTYESLNAHTNRKLKTDQVFRLSMHNFLKD